MTGSRQTTTVRDATLDVLRQLGAHRIFANPGSTEVPFLTDLPDALEFVLGLHEGSVVGMATGHAIATGRPALVNLHTTAGLGNAVGALATARVNRAPLVVLVGQQDRRHLALEPFLAGRLDGLAGTYPVWANQPVLPQDVPAAVRRAWHEAVAHRGPAIVVVPMDDWSAPMEPALGLAAPLTVRRADPGAGTAAREVAGLLDDAAAPVVVVGAGADDRKTWDALVKLVERLGAPVWQEPFGARAGFPQDHPRFAGHLPAGRSRLRAVLGGHDVALVVGTGAFRQYPYEPGPLVPDGLTVAVVSDDPDELHHSSAELAVLADPATLCAAVAAQLTARPAVAPAVRAESTAGLAPPAAGEPMRPEHVFVALAERLPRDVVLVEETPSSRPDLHRLLPVRQPRGFVSAAMGGLGFGLPAAAGLRLGDPSRPVVAVLGDGSSLYGIQGLWSAARYGCGVLFVVLSNGRYAVMDRLADRAGGKAPWPAFDDVRVHDLARALGCPARRITDHADLLAVLDEVVPTLADRTEPLLLDVPVHAGAYVEP
ncbi:thiamine pyrophosphate-dependent enzyme [Micromonospora sp. WMMD1082]|uniref:thiamine pyrophosphate-dependent enzyme n=1 Tax=Micromonospora sp. WMMD1082 TaxID=3016104 RepID=UPI002417C0C8|nr:thiamine pyrophosphate-dependent enzyme [Micromonospora sp. WMMD1082]MDG4797886.1 thiamine pyrophosphate-binding protein [Micromonospora sp. WMMD1082]